MVSVVLTLNFELKILRSTSRPGRLTGRNLQYTDPEFNNFMNQVGFTDIVTFLSWIGKSNKG